MYYIFSEIKYIKNEDCAGTMCSNDVDGIGNNNHHLEEGRKRNNKENRRNGKKRNGYNKDLCSIFKYFVTISVLNIAKNILQGFIQSKTIL